MNSWLAVPEDNGFTVDALPYGSFTAAGLRGPRVGVAIGDQVLDLTEASAWLLPDDAALFAAGTLDSFLAAGRPAWDRIRSELTHWLTDEHHRVEVEPLLRPASSAAMQLPFTVADYVDFYASEVHATNLGRMFRPDGEPLTPNWKHLPIGYHARAGTVVVSGTPVRRPHGQRRGADGITVGPSTRLDLEAELGYVVGVPSALGSSVGLDGFDDHVFGVCLVNDWSARDLQAWEYVPLGPFLGKSFATSISPWVTPLSALGSARVAPPPRDVPLQAYLDDADTPPAGLDLELSIAVNGTTLSCPSYREMYWTGAQMLAHLTVNGASLRTGDLYASGTVSSGGPRGQGSLIELSHNGAEPVRLDD